MIPLTEEAIARFWARVEKTDTCFRAIRASVEGNRPMARRYGVDPATIRRVRRGQNWGHV